MDLLLNRFLDYVSFDTQSDPNSTTYPSTAKQLALLNHLVEQMTLMGLEDVEIDPNGYVMGTLPATKGFEDRPTIGFIAHVDTSPDMSGKGVKPQIIENYNGEDIALSSSVTMRVSRFPELKLFKGDTLITTDGTTLLGADDKAGIAEIMTAMEYLIANPQTPHPKIRVGFTPDEEIGRGVDFFNVKHFGAQYAYTVDGGFEGELEFENFNAACVKVSIQGENIHPGYAKDKMINALGLACRIDNAIPAKERPEHTEGYEGFFLLMHLNGTVESAKMEYIIRDHDRKKFERRKELFNDIVEKINSELGKKVIEVEIKDQYYNMREMVEPHKQIIDIAKKAMELSGVKPLIKPIRGGTDGSKLSYMGLPCPNIFAGGMNFHSKLEYCSLNSMHKAVNTIINIARLWAEDKA